MRKKIRRHCSSRRLLIESLECRRVLATFTVDSVGDEHDIDDQDGICQTASGKCTFRAAVESANATTALDTIEFNLTGSFIAGVPSIATSGVVVKVGPVRILGDSQPGSGRVELAGPGAAGSGISLETNVLGSSSGSTIRGLVLNGFVTGINSRTADNIIVGNFIGTDVTGERALPNTFGIAADGVNTVIDGNVISGNRDFGVGVGSFLGGAGAIVIRNLIGTNKTGTKALGNGGHGLVVASSSNLIGGGDNGNVIAANGGSGIAVSNTSVMSANEIYGNRIGVDASGDASPEFGNAGHGIVVNAGKGNFIGGVGQPNIIMGSGLSGISLLPGSSNNTITANIIGGSGEHGVHIAGFNSTANVLRANSIGVGSAGALHPNMKNGVFLEAAATTLIEAGDDGPNVISGNGGHGIEIIDAFDFTQRSTVISDTVIGLLMPNGGSGIRVFQKFSSSPTNVTIGPSNTISENARYGVEFEGGPFSHQIVSNNRIVDSFIGTDPTGQFDRGNALGGVLINNMRGNTLTGGTTPNHRNVISGNDGPGIEIRGPRSLQNTVQGSWIGITDPLGSIPLGNIGSGILIHDGATNNLIGSAFASARTVVSANFGHGIELRDGANSNTIIGTFVGTDHTGRRALFEGEHILGNQGDGILVSDVSGTRIGGTIENTTGLQFNVISGNGRDGIRIEGRNATGNIVQGNVVGASFTGLQPIGNRGNGIYLDGTANGNLIGGIETLQDRGNTIFFNGGDGIAVVDSVNNAILRNVFHANGGLGIDLGNDGVTPNDVGNLDQDEGANNLQNFPVISDIVDRVVSGVYSGKPDTSFRLELFSTTEPDESGHGEGSVYVGCREITTDNQGNAEFVFGFGDKNTDASEFCGQRIVRPVNHVDFTMTATNIEEGNTSEFSPVFTGEDLAITAIAFDLPAATRVGNRLFVPVNVEVENNGPTSFDKINVLLNVDSLPLLSKSVSLPGMQRTTVAFVIDITDILAFGSGIADISVEATVDSDNSVIEVYENNNVLRVDSLNIDARPRTRPLNSDFVLPGHFFLQGISVPNYVSLAVLDWNGDLPDGLVSDQDVTSTHYKINGRAITKANGSSAKSTVEVAFDLGTDSDLQIGTNRIETSVSLNQFGWRSEPVSLEFTQVGTTLWLSQALTTVSSTGSVFRKIATYRGGFQFPALAVEGLFDLPVEQVSFLKGAFGPTFQMAIRPSFSSDGTSSITGEAKFTVEVGDKELTGGSESSVAVSLTGGLKVDSQLNVSLASLSVSVRGDITFHSAKAPLLALGFFGGIYVSGFWGAGVDTTVRFVEDQQGGLAFDTTTFGIDGKLGGNLLIGTPKVAYLEGTVTGTARGQFNLPPNPDFNARFDSTISIQAAARFFTFEVKTSKATLKCTIFGNGTCPGGEGETHLVRFPSTFTLAPRRPRLTGEGLGGASGLPNVTYAYAAPSLAVNDDGTMTLVYVDEDLTKANGQHLEIYATTHDGSQWSTPVALTNDTLLDDRPSVAYDSDGKAIAVWSRIKNTIADPQAAQPSELLREMEVVYAVRDPVTGTWSAPAALTSNDTLDFLPRLGRNAQGNVSAMWLRDEDNMTPIVGDEPLTLGTDIYTSTWNGSAWSPPSVAVANASSVDAPQFAANGNHRLLVWSEDGDRSLATPNDHSIQYASSDGNSWTTPQTLAGAGDGINDESPRVIYDKLGQATVVWVKTGVASIAGDVSADQLWFVKQNGSGFTAPAFALETDVINEPILLTDSNDNLIVVWQGQGPAGLELYYATYDQDVDHWSPPSAITNGADAEWAFQPFINANGELEVFYLQRGIVPGAGDGSGDPVPPEYSSSALVSTSIPLGPDLATTNLQQSAPSPLPGRTIQFTATVQNTGDFATTPVEIVFLDNGVEFATASVPMLTAGSSIDISVNYLIPATSGSHNLVARADANNQLTETNENNNAAALDLAVAASTTIALPSPGTLTITVDGEDVVATFGNVEVFRGLGDSIQHLHVVGSDGDDFIEVANLDFVFGGIFSAYAGTGSDTLRLLGGVQSLVLTGEDDDELRGIEEIDISGSGDNLARLDIGAVRRIQPNDDLLRVRHNDGDVVSYGSNWSVQSPQFVDGQFVHVLAQDEKRIEIINTAAYHNPISRLDTNHDGFVSPIDVLLVINDINGRGSRRLEPPTASALLSFFSYIDVNGDHFVSPLDALIIINFLNLFSNVNGEGELATDLLSKSLDVAPESAAFQPMIPWPFALSDKESLLGERDDLEHSVDYFFSQFNSKQYRELNFDVPPDGRNGNAPLASSRLPNRETMRTSSTKVAKRAGI